MVHSIVIGINKYDTTVKLVWLYHNWPKVECVSNSGFAPTFLPLGDIKKICSSFLIVFIDIPFVQFLKKLY